MANPSNPKFIRQSHLATIALNLAILAITIWMLFPLYWLLITSLKEPLEAFNLSLIPWIQFQPTLANWQREFDSRGFELIKGVTNSLFIAVWSTLIAVTLGTMAGYGLARFKFVYWRNQDMVLWFLSQRFLPPIVLLIPFFLVIKRLHILDTPLALIVVNATFTMPFVVLLMRDAFMEVPRELEESALVDGADTLTVFLYIALPLVRPALVAVLVICFAFSWNEFLFGLVLSFKSTTPITVMIATIDQSRGIEFWAVATRLLAALIPPAILSFFVQHYIVRGLTLGVVKK